MRKFIDRVMLKLGYQNSETVQEDVELIKASANNKIKSLGAEIRGLRMTLVDNRKTFTAMNRELNKKDKNISALREENANVVATTQPFIRGAEVITHDGPGYKIIIQLSGDFIRDERSLLRLAAKTDTLINSRIRKL